MFVTTLPFTTATRLADFIREGASNARWAALLRLLQHRYGIRLHSHAESYRPSWDVGEPVSSDTGKRAIQRFGLGTIAYYPTATVAGQLWPNAT